MTRTLLPTSADDQTDRLRHRYRSCDGSRALLRLTFHRQQRKPKEMMTRMSQFAAAAALIGGITAVGIAGAQEGPMDGPAGGPPDGAAGAPPTAPMHGPMDGTPMMMGGLDFAAIDTDKNGSLSRDELQARATAELAKADTNGDGALDRAEIIAALPGPSVRLFAVFAPDPAEGFADRMLAMMGATETGRVEVAALADRRVNALFAAADTDRDAAISQAEADAMRQGRHARMERGHDRHAGKGDCGDDHDGPRGRRADGPPPAPEAPRG